MPIKGEREADPGAVHDRKARRIDGGQLVQVSSSEIFPRLIEVLQAAREDPDPVARED